MLAKWILPFEVILVLYFLVIIYFIINTGELLVYLKTIFLNLIIFIELFFVQNNIDQAVKSDHEDDFYSGLWIYPFFFFVYTLITIIALHNSVWKILVLFCKRKKAEQRPLKAYKFYSLISLDLLNIVLLIGLTTTHLRIQTYNTSDIVILYTLLLISLIFTVAGYVTSAYKESIATSIHDDFLKVITDEEQ